MQSSGNSPAGPVRAIQASSGGYKRGRGGRNLHLTRAGREGGRGGGLARPANTVLDLFSCIHTTSAGREMSLLVERLNY